MEPREKLARLLAVETVGDIALDSAMCMCGDLINLGVDFGETAGPKKAIAFILELATRDMPSIARAQLHYFEGNAWQAVDALEKQTDDTVWKWDRQEIERALISHRRARLETGFLQLPTTQRSRVLTNLANSMDTVGRFVAAASTYELAMSADPGFGMPAVNRSIALWHYAQQHYDRGHQCILLWCAHELVTEALKLPLEAGTLAGASRFREQIRRTVHPDYLDAPLELQTFALGASQMEIDYRQWCLSNRLFLNPLNDCVCESIAATDILHLPDLLRPAGEGPGFHGFFNQLKQEYVSARFLLYEALRCDAVHYSDRDVKLVNTFDYAHYGLAAEKLRLAFRSAASILDKVAVFLGWYLEIPDAAGASFSTVWYRAGKSTSGLRAEFTDRANLPLRGLFWLSKDFYSTAVCGEDLDPVAKALRAVRNGLEHRYVKVLVLGAEQDVNNSLHDQLAVTIGKELFATRALEYMRYAREAMIYLSLGINVDQLQSRRRHGDTNFALPIVLDDIDDGWKM